jgi:RNA polymerase sigma-70 factor (ECF subfamily)
VVQEALLRVHRAREAGERIESPKAYVATITTRLAIDELRRARVRREAYHGEWLPEPLVADPDDHPARRVELSESLSLAFLVLLESLSPEQRAALLLRDAFDYPYDEIARVIGTSVVNARQLVARARRHVRERRPRFAPSAKQRQELANRFVSAVEHGDLASLEALLAEDVALHGDGGGRVPALTKPLHGRDRVARTLLAWNRQTLALGRASLRPTIVNGQPGALALDAEGRVFGVVALEVDRGRVRSIQSVVNPEKLRHLGTVGDLGGVLGRRGPEAS